MWCLIFALPIWCVLISSSPNGSPIVPKKLFQWGLWLGLTVLGVFQEQASWYPIRLELPVGCHFCSSMLSGISFLYTKKVSTSFQTLSQSRLWLGLTIWDVFLGWTSCYPTRYACTSITYPSVVIWAHPVSLFPVSLHQIGLRWFPRNFLLRTFRFVTCWYIVICSNLVALRVRPYRCCSGPPSTNHCPYWYFILPETLLALQLPVLSILLFLEKCFDQNVQEQIYVKW
jgi:hypothetical protein